MHLPSLKAGGEANLDEFIESQIGRTGGKVPLLYVGITSAEQTLYSSIKGKKDPWDVTSGALDKDSVFEHASDTKFLTAGKILALQAIDEGLLEAKDKGKSKFDALDDPSLVEEWLPQLKNCKVVIDSEGPGAEYEELKTKPTLRQLLDNTCGFLYSHPNYKKADKPRVSFLHTDASEEMITVPHAFQPGNEWGYGLGCDWVGVLVTRCYTNTDAFPNKTPSLEEVFKHKIFDPVGMPDTTFIPTEKVRANKAPMSLWNGHEFVPTEQWGWGRPKSKDQLSDKLLSGGAGLFGTPDDFLKLVRSVMQCSSAFRRSHGDAQSSHLISAEAYNQLWKGTENPNCQLGVQSLIQANNKRSTKADYSIGGALWLEDTGLGELANTLFWGGTFGTSWWIDPKTGIAVFAGTQYDLHKAAKNADRSARGPGPQTFKEVERTVYKNINREGSQRD